MDYVQHRCWSFGDGGVRAKVVSKDERDTKRVRKRKMWSWLLQKKNWERIDKERVSATRSNYVRKLPKTCACSRSKERERKCFGIKGEKRIRTRAGDPFDDCDWVFSHLDEFWMVSRKRACCSTFLWETLVGAMLGDSKFLIWICEQLGPFFFFSNS